MVQIHPAKSINVAPLIKIVCVCWLSLLAALSTAQGVFDHPVEAASAEAKTLEAIAQQLRDRLPIEGTIEQQKHLTILRQPMVSKGSFELTATGDLQWRIDEPFAVTYAMVAGELTRTMDGEVETITASSEPALYGFLQLFSRLFELSLTDLNSYFAVYLLDPADTGTGWVIGLTPQDSRLQKVLAHIVVQGEQGTISQVMLSEPGDDYTVLNFSYDQPDLR